MTKTVGDNSYRLKLGVFRRIGAYHIIVLVRLNKAQGPQQLPRGRIVPALQWVEPLQTDYLGLKWFGFYGILCRVSRWRGRQHDTGE
jgi:hypothetical protein